MSQVEHDTSTDATLSRGLRPEEDPWSALAVADDDVLGDNGIPSPVIGGTEAGEEDDLADDATVEAAVPPRAAAQASPGLDFRAPNVSVPSPETQAPTHGARRIEPASDAWRDAAAAAEEARVVARSHAAREPELGPEHSFASDDDGLADETVLTMIDPAIEPTRGGGFTIPLLCAGIAIIACCLLIPQADANRRLAYDRVKLQADLEGVHRQVAVNEEFLNKVSDDPNLAERLAQRQMKIIRAGTKVLALKGEGETEMSPFQLTNVAPPPQLPPYQPRGGRLAALCYSPRSRLYLMGLGLLMTAVGLVMGFGARSPD